MHAIKWVRNIGSTLGSWRRSCTWNFHRKRAFIPWLTVAQSFCPNQFLPLNIVSPHWPTPVASPHLGESPNGLKQLKRGSKWKFSQVFPLMMIKVCLPFIQKKSNLKITTYLTPWGSKHFLLTKILTKNQSLKSPKTQYKSPQSNSKQRNHVLPKKLKLQSKSSFNQLTSSQFWSLGGGNMGTGEHFLSSSQLLSISSSHWLWVEVANLLRTFSAFSRISVMAFWFVSC